MAVDKLVDSTQLDSDLTSVANAIRSKGGTSADLAFPAGFVSAVQAIPTGITPTGTKQISITANGTTTEDVTNYANAQITANVPNTYAASDEGKVVSNGALVSQASDTVTQNGPVDTTLINLLTVNVSGGLDYDLKEVTVSGNSQTVDRAFDDFIFIAQCQKSSIPAAADRARLKAYFLMFAYVNGKFIPTGGSNGFDVSTQTAGSATMTGGGTNMSIASIGATSIKFSTYSTHSMQAGKWDVLQIELPSDSPIYAFADL